MCDSAEEEAEAAGVVVPLEVAGGAGDFFSFGDLMETFRACEDKDEREFAEVLGVSESYLRDVEARRVVVSSSEAADWARAVGYPATEFVRRVLQDLVDEAGLEMRVSVEAV